MICIFSKNITARHHYTFDVIFRHWLDAEYFITERLSDYDPSRDFLISYGHNDQTAGLTVYSSGLLEEKNIRHVVPDCTDWNGVPVLFPETGVQCTIPFDLFAAVFYMISRYEEYLPYTPDQHGRFEADMSLAGIRGFLQVPVVDYWVKELRSAITQHSRGHLPEPPVFSYLPTYDIDQFYSFRHKGFLRNAAGFLRDLLKAKFALVSQRIRVLRGKEKDPFDSFDYLDGLHTRYGLKPIYFLHPGTYGPFDKNVPLHHPGATERVKHLLEKYSVGLHPSYRAARDPELLRSEIQALSSLTGVPVTCVRQHFLRIRIPETYRTFASLGIKNDYSLGWASDNGFRAGTGRSFPFYDLQREHQTSLILHPLCMMDGAFRNYQQVSPDQAKQEAAGIIRSLKETGSTCISLWHNESLGSSPHWKNWKEVYEFIIEKAI